MEGRGFSWEESGAASSRRPLYGFSVYSRQWGERNHATHMEHKKQQDTGHRPDTVHCAPRVSLADRRVAGLPRGECPPASSPGKAGTGARALSPILDIPCSGRRVGLRTKTLHNIKSRSSQFCKTGLGLGDQGDAQHCHAAIYRIVDMHLD